MDALRRMPALQREPFTGQPDAVAARSPRAGLSSPRQPIGTGRSWLSTVCRRRRSNSSCSIRLQSGCGQRRHRLQSAWWWPDGLPSVLSYGWWRVSNTEWQPPRRPRVQVPRLHRIYRRYTGNQINVVVAVACDPKENSSGSCPALRSASS
jgi:hypothetical protein